MHKICIICISAALTIAPAGAVDARATLAQVNEILATDVRTVPAVVFVDELPGRAQGDYAAGTVRISRQAVAACWPLIAAHEVAHHVAIEAGMLEGVPNENVKARLEEIAAYVEARFEPWSPSC